MLYSQNLQKQTHNFFHWGGGGARGAGPGSAFDDFFKIKNTCVLSASRANFDLFVADQKKLTKISYPLQIQHFVIHMYIFFKKCYIKASKQTGKNNKMSHISNIS